MQEKIPLSDLEMWNMQTEKDWWTWGDHWTRGETEQLDGNSHYLKWQHIGAALVAVAPLLVAGCCGGANLKTGAEVPCYMDPYWLDVGGLHDCLWLHRGWRCLPAGQDVVPPSAPSYKIEACLIYEDVLMWVIHDIHLKDTLPKHTHTHIHYYKYSILVYYCSI